MSKSHVRTFGMAACMLTAAGLAYAGGSTLYVTFETGAVPTGFEDCDAPDYCYTNELIDVNIPGDCTYINGQLEKRPDVDCEPDTFLVLFDKTSIIASNDNGSTKGNGWASGLQDVGNANGFTANGDGTRSLRIGVTGRPDGLDGNFNGFFQNAPHGQLGCFLLCIEWEDGAGNVLSTETYEDEFITGAEAFHINYTVPASAVKADINIDNTTHCLREKRVDVDIFRLVNLVPFCDYCIEQIGGLDCECRPTDTRLGWFDKSCDLIFSEGSGGAVEGYAKLCVVADVNGHIILGVTGEYDSDFDGLNDSASRAPVECPEPTPGHGVAGCYTLKVYVTVPHTGGSEPDSGAGASGEAAAMQMALDHGDLNRDGVTNTADLGILLGSFGWTQ